MTGVIVFVCHDEPAVRIGGRTLTDRSTRLAARVGLDNVRLWPTGDSVPLAAVADQTVAIIGANVLAEPKALAAFVDEIGHDNTADGLMLSDDAGPVLVGLPPGSAGRLAGHTSMRAVAETLRAHERWHDWSAAGLFCRRVHGQDAVVAQQAYLRHTNGRESFFTRQIRRFSVPLSVWLTRLRFTPTVVTTSGLMIAVLSALCIASGRYLLGVLGGLLYYLSMVFDCSDGEVARLTLHDSAFGAWLETVVDYTTYFLLLGALAWSSAALPAGARHLQATTIALAGSIVVIAVASYLRHRVAAADPGQFDESSAQMLKQAGAIHRFARWGRKWIKRSTVAHLVVVLAILDQLPALIYLWAFGATVASVVIVAVSPFVVKRVQVRPVAVAPRGQR